MLAGLPCCNDALFSYFFNHTSPPPPLERTLLFFYQPPLFILLIAPLNLLYRSTFCSSLLTVDYCFVLLSTVGRSLQRSTQVEFTNSWFRYLLYRSTFCSSLLTVDYCFVLLLTVGRLLQRSPQVLFYHVCDDTIHYATSPFRLLIVQSGNVI